MPPPLMGSLNYPEEREMASLSISGKGLARVLFTAPDGKRKTIYLGRTPKKTAEGIRVKVEHLENAASSRLPLDQETARWLGDIGDDLHRKLAAVGLIPARQSATLGKFLLEYLEARKSDGSKPATVVTIHRVIHDLTQFFGANADLRTVAEADAERFKQHYQKRELAAATVYRRLKMAKMLFGHAVKVKLIPANPFALVRSKNANPVERRQYVTEADTEKLLSVANPAWRTIIALARYGGLRCPSEVLSLKWEDVYLASGRMTITSPKTEHIEGKEYRVCPVFARLRPHLKDAWELAAPGEVYVVGGKQGNDYRATAQKPGGWVNTNLRTTFEKLVRRAGLTAWPRLFQALRASCETDLMEKHSIHVVTAWVGNTPRIALGHYLQTLDGDFEKAIRGDDAKGDARATQKATLPPSAGRRHGTTESTEPLVLEGNASAPVVRGRDVSVCSDGQGGTRTHTYCYARF